MAKKDEKAPGQPRETPRKNDSPEQSEVRTSVTKAMRDLAVWEMALDGMGATEIAKLDGRTDRQIRQIISDFKKNPPGSTSPLEQDAVQIIEGLLRRTQFVWRSAAMTAVSADSDNSRIGALKVMLEADAKLLGILQHTGKMPRELGTLRHVLDLRAVGEAMVDVIDRFAAGEASVEEVRSHFRELAGLGRELPVADAEVVPDEARPDTDG